MNGLDMIANLVIILVSLVILDQASHLTITYSVKVSDITKLGRTTVGFLVLAFSTSLPEFVVAFIAALSANPVTGQSEAPLSVGNVLGSNIVNVCLIVGLATLLVTIRGRKTAKPLPAVAKEELSSLYFGLFIASVIPLSLIYVAGIGWFVGFVLILIFIAYTYQMSRIRIPVAESEGTPEEEKKKLRRYVALTIIGIAGVVASAYFMVESAVLVARLVNVPESLIGATIIAFGTSIPELSLTVRAFLKGQTGLGLGNIVGSGFINTTLILGISLLIPAVVGIPFSINMFIFEDLVIFSLISNLFMWYFLSAERLTWKEAAIFLFIYALFLATALGALPLRQQQP